MARRKNLFDLVPGDMIYVGGSDVTYVKTVDRSKVYKVMMIGLDNGEILVGSLIEQGWADGHH